MTSAVSSVRQRVVVQYNLLSWFERWHPQIRTAGTSERITKITLPQTSEKSLLFYAVNRLL